MPVIGSIEDAFVRGLRQTPFAQPRDDAFEGEDVGVTGLAKVQTVRHGCIEMCRLQEARRFAEARRGVEDANGRQREKRLVGVSGRFWEMDEPGLGLLQHGPFVLGDMMIAVKVREPELFDEGRVSSGDAPVPDEMLQMPDRLGIVPVMIMEVRSDAVAPLLFRDLLRLAGSFQASRQ